MNLEYNLGYYVNFNNLLKEMLKQFMKTLLLFFCFMEITFKPNSTHAHT